MIERSDFLGRMQRAIVSAAQSGTVAPGDVVEYQEHIYYPCGYTLTCDEQGRYRHLAILHDLHANSIMQGELEKVAGDVSPDRLTYSKPIVPYSPPVTYADKDKIIADLKAQLATAIEELRKIGDCDSCKHRDTMDDDCIFIPRESLPCKSCDHPCKCIDCKDSDNWEWKGAEQDHPTEKGGAEG